MNDHTTASDEIRTIFEDRGTCTPWWALPQPLRMPIIGFLTTFVLLTLRDHLDGPATNRTAFFAGFVLWVAATVSWAAVIGQHVRRHVAPSATCPDLDVLDSDAATALMNALRTSHRESRYWTRAGAQAAVYRNRAAILAAIRLTAGGGALPHDVTGTDALDRLIDVARAAR